MKRFRPLLLCLALAALGASAFAADSAPTLPIDQALKIAQGYLQEKGVAGQVQIVGLTVEHATAKTSYWYAKWSSLIDNGKKRENGLRIDMDGTITRFVEGNDSTITTSDGTVSRWGGEKPSGQRPVGARSMR